MSKPVTQLHYSLRSNEVVFATNGKQNVTFAIYDGDFHKLREITAVEGSDCFDSLSKKQKETVQKYGDYVYCLP